MTYLLKNIVCRILQDTLKQNGLYFLEVYNEGDYYYVMDTLFYDTIPLSVDTLTKLFGEEYSLYFVLNEGHIRLPYIILRWSKEQEAYTVRFIKSGATTSPFNSNYKETSLNCASFFNKLQPLLQMEARKIEEALAYCPTNRRYYEYEVEYIMANVYKKRLYTPFSLDEI